MLADYRHTSMSLGTHPLALLRAHLPEGTLSSTELHEARHGCAGGIRGDDGRAPAPVDREGNRLHAPRGRARPGEPHRPVGGLRAASRDGARRAADSRPRPLRARRGEPQRPRLDARVARAARTARSRRTTPSGSRSRARTPSATAEVRRLCSQRVGGALRPERGDRHRLPRRRRRPDRPRVRPGRVHAPRDRVGASAVPAVLRATRRVHATRPLRQARNGHVGPRSWRDDARGADGRHPRRPRHGRERARGRHGRVGGRAARDPLRRRAPGAHPVSDPPGRGGARAP